MVPTGKPVPSTKPKPTTENNPAIPASVVRHVIPALTPLPAAKPAAEPTGPATSATEAVAPAKVAKLASPEPQATTAPAPASASKPVEKLGPKLRRKDEILRALRTGSKVEKVDGLFRIVAQDGTRNATSKRRILSLESQKFLIASADGNFFTLNLEADKKAQEPKPAPAAKESAKDSK
jgi:hypothetical protein